MLIFCKPKGFIQFGEKWMLTQGRETEMVVLTTGGDMPGVWIPAGTYHSLEATDCMSVIVEAKAGKYDPETTEEFL